MSDSNSAVGSTAQVRDDADDGPWSINALTGQPAESAMLVDVARLITAYYTEAPDSSRLPLRAPNGVEQGRGSR